MTDVLGREGPFSNQQVDQVKGFSQGLEIVEDKS